MNIGEISNNINELQKINNTIYTILQELVEEVKSNKLNKHFGECYTDIEYFENQHNEIISKIDMKNLYNNKTEQTKEYISRLTKITTDFKGLISSYEETKEKTKDILLTFKKIKELFLQLYLIKPIKEEYSNYFFETISNYILINKIQTPQFDNPDFYPEMLAIIGTFEDEKLEQYINEVLDEIEQSEKIQNNDEEIEETGVETFSTKTELPTDLNDYDYVEKMIRNTTKKLL